MLRFRGTLPPAFLASDNPIAIACLRLVTLLPDPERSVPFLRSCIARSTFSDAFFPYRCVPREVLATRAPFVAARDRRFKMLAVSSRRFGMAARHPPYGRDVRTVTWYSVLGIRLAHLANQPVVLRAYAMSIGRFVERSVIGMPLGLR